MIKTTLTTAALLLSSIPAMAQGIDPAVHDMCKDAKDYAGCVRAMTTDVSTQNINVDQTHRPGLLSEMGNDCPAGTAYVGAGRCRAVVCVMKGSFGRNNPELGGKGHRCEKGWGNWFGYRGSLEWGNSYTNASNNPSCPQREPQYGYRSSCSDSRLSELTGNGRSVDTSDWDSSPTDYIPVED